MVDTRSKKHSSAKGNPSSVSGNDKVCIAQDYGEGLVGSRIRVWWPIDRKFYKGVVNSFNSSKKRHKILYDDGDKEDLIMKNQRWELLDEDDATADEISLQKESDYESSDATPELSNRKKATRNGKSSENGRMDETMSKKKQKIGSSANRKSRAKSGKKSEDGEGASEKPKGAARKAAKSKGEAKQALKTKSKRGSERNDNLGDIGGKIVAAASRMNGRFRSQENGLENQTQKSMKSSKKLSESNNPKRKRPSSSSEAVSKKVKKPRTSSKKIKSNNTDDEDDDDDDDDTSDDDSKPLSSFLKKSPEAIEAFMKKLKRKKEKEEGEGTAGNEAEPVKEEGKEASTDEEELVEEEVEGTSGDEAEPVEEEGEGASENEAEPVEEEGEGASRDEAESGEESE